MPPVLWTTYWFHILSIKILSTLTRLIGFHSLTAACKPSRRQCQPPVVSFDGQLGVDPVSSFLWRDTESDDSVTVAVTRRDSVLLNRGQGVGQERRNFKLCFGDFLWLSVASHAGWHRISCFLFKQTFFLAFFFKETLCNVWFTLMEHKLLIRRGHNSWCAHISHCQLRSPTFQTFYLNL